MGLHKVIQDLNTLKGIFQISLILVNFHEILNKNLL